MNHHPVCFTKPGRLTLSVIIVNYNVKYLLEQCLYAVGKAIGTMDAEVFVVDNHSSDKSILYLKPLFPWVIFLENEQNTGFSKANNRALSLSRGKYILFLNPDTLIPENCFTYCIRFFEKTPQAGALGLRMLNGKGKFLPESKRAFPSPLTSLFKLAGLAALFPASGYFNHYGLGAYDKTKNQEVAVLAGAFMMVKKKILEKTGGFDESFFMYGEDVDLSCRIRQAGFKNYYLGKICMLHFKGASSLPKNRQTVRLFYRAMVLFVHKYYRDRSILYRTCLVSAIQARAMLARTAGWLHPTGGSTAPGEFFRWMQAMLSGIRPAGGQNRRRQTIVIGTEEEYARVKKRLPDSGMQKRRFIRIAPAACQQPDRNTIQLCCLLQLLKKREVVFCLGSLSYAAVITLIQSLPHCNCYFFNAGSLVKSGSGGIVQNT